MPRTTVFAILLAAYVAIPTRGQAPPAQEPQSTPVAAATAPSDADVARQAIRQNLREQRRKAIASNVALTADEASRFWPIYDQYIDETIKVNDVRWDMIKGYADNYQNMTDQLAADYMEKSAAVDQQLVALRDKYVPIFEKVISVQKTCRWYQTDRRLDLMINLRLSSMIPLVNMGDQNQATQ